MKRFSEIAVSNGLIAIIALLFAACLLIQSKSSRAQAGQSRAAAPAAAGDNKELPTSAPADAQPLACPAAGAALELAAGDWALAGDCTAGGLKLRGDAQLWSEGVAFTIAGNISLQDHAGLHIHGGTFNLADQYKHEYHIENKGNAVIDIRDAKMMTNAGLNANLTSSFSGSDDSLLHIENVQLDPLTSWLLANFRDRARLETKDSPHCPTEIYPSGDSTLRIEGPGEVPSLWLRFESGSSVVLDGLPVTHPFTFSFGRNTPGVTGIGYQVDVVNASPAFRVISYPGSKIALKNSNIGIGYEFVNVTASETITGLKGGEQTGTYTNQGRVLDLENATVPAPGWQIYSSNDGIDPTKLAPVNVSDSMINEMGALKQGWFEAEHVHFAFATLAAVGAGSKVHIRDSIISSHIIMADADGVMKIEDSQIYGSLVQAIAHSRVLLLNTTLLTNDPNPNCTPVLPTSDGKPRTRCNPFNPEQDVDFITRGDGMVLVAGIDPIPAEINPGNQYTFTGNAIVKTAADRPYTYSLRYRRASGTDFTDIVAGATGPKRSQPLGQLDTADLPVGDYIVELRLIVPGQDPIVVQRPFTIAKLL